MANTALVAPPQRTAPMKLLDNIIIQLLILILVLTAPLIFAESGTGAAFLPSEIKRPNTERISPQALIQLKALHQKTGGFKSSSSDAPLGGYMKQDIYRNSIILQIGHTHTVLPPHSVIYLPTSLSKMVVTSASGSYVPWPEFCVQNRSKIITHSVTLKQAMGQEKIQPKVSQQLKQINRVVVAIYQNNPISILSRD